MDWTTILGSVSGGVLGFAGALVTKVVGIFEAREQHKMTMERLEMASKVDLQKADLSLRQTREESAGASFTAAIQADAAMPGESRWVRDFRAMWRPGLTAFLVLAAIVQGFWFGQEIGAFIAISLSSLAGQAVGFWFGVRQWDKTVITPVSFGGKK
jgi:hypothetical protein